MKPLALPRFTECSPNLNPQALSTSITFDDGHSVYELAAERHHDHMVDVDNGHVTEFVNERIEALQHEIAEEHGYELVHHELVLYVRKKDKSD